MKYHVQNQDIELELSSSVFSPSLHGSSAIGGSIKIHSGESVLDIGTGTGILAILAAKLGGEVTASDVVSEAVFLTDKNAKRNAVDIHVVQSNLFESFTDQKYDVIIANLPQENLSPKVLSLVSPQVATGMHGGKNGNELLLRFLKEAPSHMYQHSRLYIVVYSMSNFRESLEAIIDQFEVKLINFYTGPVKDFVYMDAEWYEGEAEKGVLGLYKKGDEYFADLFVLELGLKK